MEKGKRNEEEKREWRRRKGKGKVEEGREKEQLGKECKGALPPPVPPAAANFFEVCAGFRIL